MALPTAFEGIHPKMIRASNGAASGIVSEGMGYGLMIEGFQAYSGSAQALENGVALMRGWLGMVKGPEGGVQPWAGGNGKKGSATEVDVWPYGISAIEGAKGKVAAGLAPWKYPMDQCGPDGCVGGATDGDEDATLGMIYLTAALDYPEDFADVTMRTIISFASGDLGFPDMYRTLSDGTKAFVPKGGSQWGGLVPATGKWNSSQAPGCYNPSYFAPGHYKLFRDYVKANWKKDYDDYLPPHMDGSASTVEELQESFDGAVVAGYNLLQYSSCPSGVVSNWVGSQWNCTTDSYLNCPGVPWAETPYVGEKGTCNTSGTMWGGWGAEAGRTPWRIAMDFIMYPEDTVQMYDQSGAPVEITNAAQEYLNSIATQYRGHSRCNGGVGNCTDKKGVVKISEIEPAFSGDFIMCDNVPRNDTKKGGGWYSAFMAYPTFTALVAPCTSLKEKESKLWMDTFSSICDWHGGHPQGDLCSTQYFEASQEVISTMIMSGAVVPLEMKPGTKAAHLETEVV